jgi:carboxypeptidase family protein
MAKDGNDIRKRPGLKDLVTIICLTVIAMKGRMHVRGIVTVLFLVVCATTVVAQESETDICVLEHLTAKRLTGRVVSARLESEVEKPLANAAVELRRIGDQEVIARTVTDSNGHFVFPDVLPGAYALAATSPRAYRVALFATAVEVRLVGGKPEKQSKEIVLALGWLFNGCHGGYAAMRTKSK